MNERIKELAEQAETYAAENSGAFRGEIYMRCFTEKFAELVSAAERELCAKVCELEADNFRRDIEYERADASEWCAAAIRARGEK